MPSIGSILFFAAGAAAQVTTSIWLPGSGDYYYGYGSSSDRFVDNFEASIVAKDGDKTTMALNGVQSSASRGSYRDTTRTVTIHGTTSFEWVSEYNSRIGYERTYSMGCSLAESTKVVCTSASLGTNMYSSYCSRYTEVETYGPETTTRRITYSNPPQTVTQVYTDTGSNYTPRVPSVCLSGSTLPESFYKSSFTVRPETYQVVVTAAAERLTATSGPSATGSGASNGTAGTSGPQNTGSPSPSSSSQAPPAPAGNAAPMITLAPAIAGLGAAAAALFL